jgi:hypothetical protein
MPVSRLDVLFYGPYNIVALMKNKTTATVTVGRMETDLLSDAVFTIRSSPSETDVTHVTLPGLLAAAVRHPDIVLVHMRPHQEHAVLSTLVYLAAACGDEPHQDEAKYRKHLLALAGGVREAFYLFVEDISKPAWLQSPGVPSRSKASNPEAGRLYSPAALDIFFTRDSFGPAKHHLRDPDAESWIYALISQQAQAIPAASSGTTARGSRGRMALSVVPSLGFGARLARAVSLALEHRKAIVSKHGYAAKGGAVLLWLKPFVSASDCYEASQIDPFFIDDSSKIRLFSHGGQLYARRFTFEPQQGETKMQRKFRRVALPLGVTGDLWTPIVVRKSDRRPGSAGWLLESPVAYCAAVEKDDMPGPFSYDRVVKLLFSGNCELPVAYRDRDGIESGYILLQGIGVPKRAGTCGWNERAIPITTSTLHALAGDRVGVFADMHMKLATRAQGILTDALMTMLKGERMKNAAPSPMVLGYVIDFHRQIDAVFFESLVARVDGAPLTDWAEIVLRIMRSVFDKATSLLPLSRSPQAYALARDVLSLPFLEKPKGKRGRPAPVEQHEQHA